MPYGDIPHFKASTAPGHQGRLVFGTLAGRPVAVMQGRMHHYEGYTYEETAYAVRVLRLLGCAHLIVTNAAGCVRTDWQAGDLMLITDQIKLFSESPLRERTCPSLVPASPMPPICTLPGSRPWPGKWPPPRGCPCGKGSISTASDPSMRRLLRSVLSAPWEATQLACQLPRRSLWPPTAAWRFWASPC